MATGLRERVRGFIDSSPAFTREEFAAALGLPKGAVPVGRLLRQEADAGRIQGVGGGVYGAGPDSRLPGPFALQDCVYASRLRPDGVLGYHTALELYGISYTVRYNTVHLISDGRTETVDLPCQACSIVRTPRALVAAGRPDFLTMKAKPSRPPKGMPFSSVFSGYISPTISVRSVTPNLQGPWSGWSPRSPGKDRGTVEKQRGNCSMKLR